jgi:hypothetical protein
MTRMRLGPVVGRAVGRYDAGASKAEVMLEVSRGICRDYSVISRLRQHGGLRRSP